MRDARQGRGRRGGSVAVRGRARGGRGEKRRRRGLCPCRSRLEATRQAAVRGGGEAVGRPREESCLRSALPLPAGASGWQRADASGSGRAAGMRTARPCPPCRPHGVPSAPRHGVDSAGAGCGGVARAAAKVPPLPARQGRAGLTLEWDIGPAWTGLQDAARGPRRPRPMRAAGLEQGRNVRRARRHRLAAG